MAQSSPKKKASGAKARRQPRIEAVPSSSAAAESATDAVAPEHGPEDEQEHGAPTCTIGFCPICLAVTAMQPIRPDVLEHLLNAGREFLLAARSVLDARADAVAPEDRATLEKIDIG